MILNYAPEQYQEVARRLTARHNTTNYNAEAQESLVAASACLELLKLAEQNRGLREIISNTSRNLALHLEHLDRLS